MSAPRHKWWKVYFVLVVATTLGALAMPFIGEVQPPWHEWAFIPLYVLQLIGLFGFVFWRRLGVPRIWQIVFVAAIAYEVGDAISMASELDLGNSGHLAFLATMGTLTLLLQGPMLVGLYLYAFRCRDLWTAAPSP